MKYTLYIDESGDFETQRGQWVLSGMLFSESYDNCEKHLTNKFKGLPKELGLKSMKEFHLTEFRKNFGHEVAVEMADKTISKLDKLPFEYCSLVAINFSKTSLSTREKTYRLMLADVLALSDTVIGEGQAITNLDLVVASRTIDGEIQTTKSNINQEIIKSLPVALEVDLATKGFVELIGKHINIHMDYANNSWGLICADFLANLNYHYTRPNEKLLLDTLEKKGKYFLFESFGGYEIRKANIAERDRDYILSLFRWIIIRHKEIDIQKSEAAIQRLISKLFNMRGSTGNEIGYEALLDRLWREYNTFEKYADLANILILFETALETHSQNNKDFSIEIYLFRLRNLMLIINNHLGRTRDALEISKKQTKAIPTLALNPEYFNMILEFHVLEIEIYVNSLDFEHALLLSMKYTSLIESYKEVWQLLMGDGDISIFDNSRASIKAKMTSVRCEILYAGIDSKPLSDMPESFLALGNRLTDHLDKSRYQNYKIMYLLKQDELLKAVSLAESCLKEMDQININEFDFFWSLRAINDALLKETPINKELFEALIQEKTNGLNLIKKGHPTDLILRELALFEYQSGDKSKALKYIRRHKKSIDLADSEITRWLKALADAHDDYINDNIKPIAHYLKSIENNVFVQNLLKDKSHSNLLVKLRHVSPY